MTETIQQLRVGVAKAVLLTLLLVVAAIVLGYGVARWLGKPQLALDIATAGGVLLLAGVPGLVLAVVLTGRVRGGASMGFVAGIVVRLPVGGVLAFNGLNWGLANSPSFTQVVAAAYLAILGLEIVCMSPAVKRTAAAEARTHLNKQPPAETKATGEEESV